MGSVAVMPQVSARHQKNASGMAGINARMLERRRVFPDDGLFKVNTVVEIIDVGKSTWFDWVKSGFAPQPVKIGCNTFWRGQDIWRFIEGVCGDADV